MPLSETGVLVKMLANVTPTLPSRLGQARGLLRHHILEGSITPASASDSTNPCLLFTQRCLASESLV